MKKAGVERFDVEVVFPEREVAQRLAYRLGSSTVLDFMPLGEKHAIQEIGVSYDWIGSSQRELALPSRESIQVVALFEFLGQRWDVAPSFRTGDPPHSPNPDGCYLRGEPAPPRDRRASS